MMRILRKSSFSIRDAHKAEQLDGTGAGLILGHAQVNLEWLGQLHADGKHRV